MIQVWFGLVRHPSLALWATALARFMFQLMEKSLATGALILGCGYLGQVVARQWLSQGKPVAALTRSRSDELRSQGIEPVVGDVTDPTFQLPSADTVLYAIGLD